MKKATLKNCLSVLISFLIMSSSFGVLAIDNATKNQSADSITVETEQAMELLDALDFNLPEFESASEIVTRGEFVYVLMQALGYNPSESAASTSFSDVSLGDYFANAIESALDMGIVSQGEMFYPHRSITANEAYKMMVVSLGMTHRANSRGGYPHGFFAVAKECDLASGIELSGSDSVSRNEFYVLMTNLLKTPIFETTGIVNGDAKMTDEYTVMERYFDVYETEGVVFADEFTSLYDCDAHEENGFVQVGETTYKCSFLPKLGYNATIYVKRSSSSKDEIIYATYENNKVLKTQTADLTFVNSSRFECENEDGDIKSVSLINSPSYIYNGKADVKILSSGLTNFDAIVEFVDNDLNGKYDVVKIWESKDFLVDYVNAEDEYISGKNSPGIELADSSDKKYFITIDGVRASLSDVKPGTIASCFVSRDGFLINIDVSTKKVSGKIEGYDNSRNSVIVNGIRYKYSKAFEDNFKAVASIGTSGTLLLSGRGIAEAFICESESSMDYGYLIDIKKTTGLDGALKIKLCTSQSDITVFDVSEKVMLNGAGKKNSDDLVSVFAPSGVANEQLIRYAVDKGGKISKIDTQDKTGFLAGDESDDDNLTLYKFPSNLTGNVTFLKSTSIVFPFFEVSDSAVMFRICTNPELSEEQRYRAYNAKNYLSNTAAGMKARLTKVYNVTRDNVAGALVVTGDTIGKPIDEYSTGGVIHSVTDALTDNGTRGLKVVIVKGQNYETYYINDEEVLRAADSNASFDNPCIEPGDAVRISVGDSETLESITLDFDYSASKVLESSTSHNAICRYYFGEIYDKVGDKIMVVQKDVNDSSLEITNDTMRYVWRVSGIIPIFDTEKNEIYHSTVDDIRTYLSSGGGCSKVLVRTSNGSVTYMVIYR